MKQKAFEYTLPSYYRQVYHLNAKSLKVGILFNVIALVVMLATLGLAAIPMLALKIPYTDVSSVWIILFPLLLIAAMMVYVVLHELVHGLAYKLSTGQRLSFGISWSCAFCGVPKIYTYRRVA